MERATRQRQAIQAALQAAGRPLLPAEILHAAQAEVPSLGQATVYRALRQLLDAGAIQPVELPREPARYELAGHRHHHHFHCRGCSRVFDIDACPGDMQALAPAGFAIEDHELTLYGQCADCRPGHGSPRRRPAERTGD